MCSLPARNQENAAAIATCKSALEKALGAKPLAAGVLEPHISNVSRSDMNSFGYQVGVGEVREGPVPGQAHQNNRCVARVPTRTSAKKRAPWILEAPITTITITTPPLPPLARLLQTN